MTDGRPRWAAPRWWALWRLGAALTGLAAAGGVIGSAYFWGALAPAQIRALEAAVARSPRPADPRPADLAARVRQVSQALAATSARLPATVTTVALAQAVAAAARASGVAVQAISVGSTTPVNGVDGTAVSVTIQSPGPLATVAFIQALTHGSLAASVALSTLALAPVPGTVTLAVTFYSTGGLAG
jgi:hypothetical protein